MTSKKKNLRHACETSSFNQDSDRITSKHDRTLRCVMRGNMFFLASGIGVDFLRRIECCVLSAQSKDV